MDIAKQATPSPRAKATLESLEKIKQSLSVHCDDVVVALAELNRTKDINKNLQTPSSASSSQTVQLSPPESPLPINESLQSESLNGTSKNGEYTYIVFPYIICSKNIL